MFQIVQYEDIVKIFRLRAEIQSPVYHNVSTATISKVIIGVLQRVGLDRILTLGTLCTYEQSLQTIFMEWRPGLKLCCAPPPFQDRVKLFAPPF